MIVLLLMTMVIEYDGDCANVVVVIIIVTMMMMWLKFMLTMVINVLMVVLS